MSNSEYGKNTSSSVSRVSQLTSDEQSFNDRLSLIVRKLNNKYECVENKSNASVIQTAENGYTTRIESDVILDLADYATITREFQMTYATFTIFQE